MAIKREETAMISRIVAEAQAGKAFRPVAMSIIQDQTRRILLVRSAKGPGEWHFPQGGIEPGESAEEALVREIGEETGIEAGNLQDVRYAGWDDLAAEAGRADRRGFATGKRYVCFVLSYVGGPELALNREELADYAWVPEEDLPAKLAAVREEKRRLMRRFLDG